MMTKGCPGCLSLRAEIERLRLELELTTDAMDTFCLYGIPPNDITGIGEWKRALDIRSELAAREAVEEE